MNRTQLTTKLVEAFKQQLIADGFDDTTSAASEYQAELDNKTDAELLKEAKKVGVIS